MPVLGTVTKSLSEFRLPEAVKVTVFVYGYGLFTGGLGAHYGAEALGCAVLPTGAGNTEKQIMLMKDLGVTAICCTPSYFLHLATVAERMGIDFRRDTKLRHGVFGADMKVELLNDGPVTIWIDSVQ